MTQHEFETTIGDELRPQDLDNATYKVVETFVTWNEIEVVFTHRVELWQTDDQLLADIPGTTPEEKREWLERRLREIRDEEGS